MSTPMVFVACLGGHLIAVDATSIEFPTSSVRAVLDGTAVMSVGVATPWAFVPAAAYEKWRKAYVDGSLFNQVFGPSPFGRR